MQVSELLQENITAGEELFMYCVIRYGPLQTPLPPFDQE